MVDSPVVLRRQRAYAQRRELIIDTARAVAENEGWDSVTTRRLADAIEFSQPVLYSHFPGGKSEIMNAVALRGFAAMARAMTPATPPRSDRSLLAAGVRGYLDFAAANPEVYRAMFALPISARFAGDEATDEMKAAFDATGSALRNKAKPGRDLETLTEVLWSTLHGLATLERDHRLRPAARERRIQALLDLFLGTR